MYLLGAVGSVIVNVAPYPAWLLAKIHAMTLDTLRRLPDSCPFLRIRCGYVALENAVEILRQTQSHYPQ